MTKLHPSPHPKDSIDSILEKRRILITCGTGGVGKTTLSAALALRSALRGRKTVVITIDPAKRLATALGLQHLGDEPTDLTPELHKIHALALKKGVPLPPKCMGSLHAIMPDTRRTFESFVRSLAPSSGLAERVIHNPIFEIFAREFSGTNEYMALQRLYALHELQAYDCIILDTPPSHNMLAFLDAPRLLARFFEEKLIRWLVLPANQIVSVGMRKALGILEKLTGSSFMTELLDFASGLFEIHVPFSANLKKITALLESHEVGFLIVTTPDPENAPELAFFIRSLQDHSFHFDGVALNRTLGYLRLKTEEGIKTEEAQSAHGEEKNALELLLALQNREKRALAEIQRAIKTALGEDKLSTLLARLPELARDVHSVEDLFHVAMAFDHSSDSSAHP